MENNHQEEEEAPAGKSLLLCRATEIKANNQVKLLSVTLDPQLTFDNHLEALKTKTTKCL
jgi:hypothetical protein